MATAFLIHTQLSWGKTCDYLIANDVEPGLMHRYETREDWQEVILDAFDLITKWRCARQRQRLRAEEK